MIKMKIAVYPVFREVNNWLIIDTQIIYDYGDIPSPVTVVNVLIGTLHRNNDRTPITRWMTREQFNKYIERYV